MIRRTVPNDNSCLFYAIAYCAEGAEASRSVEQRLRGLMRDNVLSDPDPETRALFLGKPVAEYAEWIMNPHHWGGEPEIVALSDHYKVEIAVVSCEMMSTIVYGEGASGGRIYILYTGSHYDPLVSGASPDAMPSEERKIQPSEPNGELEASALAIAKKQIEDAAKKAKQKRVKKIKCGGCGALLDTNEAFQAHCMDETVMHDDDFSFDCTEIEVVYEDGDALPEGSIDLSDETKVYAFYNSQSYPFSNVYMGSCPVEVDSQKYPSAEHAWQCCKFIEAAPALAKRIRETETVDAAHLISHSEGMDQIREDWDIVKYDMLLKILRAKFQQSTVLKEQLLATGTRLLVNVDIDKWAGMSAAGGIATGANNMGKALMKVREELSSGDTTIAQI